MALETIMFWFLTMLNLGSVDLPNSPMEEKRRIEMQKRKLKEQEEKRKAGHSAR